LNSKIQRKNHYLEVLKSEIGRKNHYLDILIEKLEGKTTTLKFCHKVVKNFQEAIQNLKDVRPKNNILKRNHCVL
jgi:hypothetical protein